MPSTAIAPRGGEDVLYRGIRPRSYSDDDSKDHGHRLVFPAQVKKKEKSTFRNLFRISRSKENISLPFDVRIVHHVSVNTSGCYEGITPEMEAMLKAAGITDTEIKNNPSELKQVVEFQGSYSQQTAGGAGARRGEKKRPPPPTGPKPQLKLHTGTRKAPHDKLAKSSSESTILKSQCDIPEWTHHHEPELANQKEATTAEASPSSSTSPKHEEERHRESRDSKQRDTEKKGRRETESPPTKHTSERRLPSPEEMDDVASSTPEADCKDYTASNDESEDREILEIKPCKREKHVQPQVDIRDLLSKDNPDV